jgi:hypothetical protein
VSAAPNPPTTPTQRFRMEVVSLGEHLHRVIDEARAANDAIQREHARGELGRALRAIRATAASFGQMSVAQTVEAYLERTGDLNVSALDAISSFAATISPAATAPTPPIGHEAGPLRMSAARSAVASLGTANHPAPSPLPPPAHARVFAAVSPKPAAASIDSALAAFESLSEERLAEPVPLSDDVLPVDILLYRGRAALDRAVELRDEIRRSGAHPSPELLEELYDLVELARID